jgi:Glycosyl transferase family 2
VGRVPLIRRLFPRTHRPFLVLLALGVLLRVIVMVGYRPAIFYIDSFASYLLPLPTLDPTGQDPIGYDLYLLGPVLKVANLSTVAAIQHLLGIGMAVGGYALLRHKGAGRWLAALAVAPVLFDAYQVQIEHNLMADPLFEALLVAALVALAWPDRPGWVVVVAAGLLLGLAATVREVGTVMIVPLVLYPLIAGGRWWRRGALAAVAALGFLVPVAAYATYYHGFTGKYALSHAGSNALYGRVAVFADCDTLDLPDEERVLCPNVPLAQRPGPDFWAHDPTSPFFRLQQAAGDRTDVLARDFAIRVIRNQPLDFAASVGGDAAKALSWQRGDYGSWSPPVERWRYQTEFPTFPDLVTIDSITELSHKYGDGAPVVVRPIAVLLRGYQTSVGYTPGPLLVVLAVLAIAGARRRPEPLLFLASGVLVMLGGDVVEFSWRYQLPGYILLPLAGALGIVALRRPAPAPFPEPADEAALATIDPDLTFPPVAVLIAAYNEADGIGAVLDAVPARCCGLDVASLVVVDGATDGTAEVARAHGAVVCAVPVNRGQGAALRLGYHLAAQRGARFVVTTDADGQYDLAELPVLLEPLIAGTADFVTGSRRLGANESTDPVRRLGTRVFAGLVSLLTRQRITDTSFGFRAMRAEILSQVTLTQPQYQSSELLIGVLSHGYRVAERPMTMRRRTQGRSKKGGNLAYGARYARVVVGTWWRERASASEPGTQRGA